MITYRGIFTLLKKYDRLSVLNPSPELSKKFLILSRSGIIAWENDVETAVHHISLVQNKPLFVQVNWWTDGSRKGLYSQKAYRVISQKKFTDTDGNVTSEFYVIDTGYGKAGVPKARCRAVALVDPVLPVAEKMVSA